MFNLDPLVLGELEILGVVLLGDLGDGSLPVESRGKVPVWGLGLPEAEAFFVNECIKFQCSKNENV